MSCDKENENAVPTCVQDKLAAFEANQACGDNATLIKYKFQNETAYVFYPGNCGADLSSEVINEDCGSMGTLGGITGNEIINGENFYEEAVLESTIWKN